MIRTSAAEYIHTPGAPVLSPPPLKTKYEAWRLVSMPAVLIPDHNLQKSGVVVCCRFVIFFNHGPQEGRYHFREAGPLHGG